MNRVTTDGRLGRIMGMGTTDGRLGIIMSGDTTDGQLRMIMGSLVSRLISSYKRMEVKSLVALGGSNR